MFDPSCAVKMYTRSISYVQSVHEVSSFDLLTHPAVSILPRQMDFPHFGNNIEEYMQSTGSPEEVTKGSAPDLTPEVLEKFDVSVGADGVLTLSPKADTQQSD